MELNGVTLVVGLAVIGGAAYVGKKAWDRHQRINGVMDEHDQLVQDFATSEKATKAKFAQIDTSYEALVGRINDLETVTGDDMGDVSIEPTDAGEKIATVATSIRHRRVRVSKQPATAGAAS